MQSVQHKIEAIENALRNNITTGTSQLIEFWEETVAGRVWLSPVQSTQIDRLTNEYLAANNETHASLKRIRDNIDISTSAASSDEQTVRSWIRISSILRLEKEICSWFVRSADRLGRDLMFRFASVELERALTAQGLWAELGWTHRNPAEVVRFSCYTSDKIMRTLESIGIERSSRDQIDVVSKTREYAATLYIACLAAHRHNESSDILNILLSWDNPCDVYRRFLEIAIDSGHAMVHHKEWIAILEDMGHDTTQLEHRLSRALGE